MTVIVIHRDKVYVDSRQTLVGSIHTQVSKVVRAPFGTFTCSGDPTNLDVVLEMMRRETTAGRDPWLVRMGQELGSSSDVNTVIIAKDLDGAVKNMYAGNGAIWITPTVDAHTNGTSNDAFGSGRDFFYAYNRIFGVAEAFMQTCRHHSDCAEPVEVF